MAGPHSPSVPPRGRSHLHPQAWGWAVLTSQVNGENHQQLRASLPSPSRVNSSSEIFTLPPTRGTPSVSGQAGTLPPPPPSPCLVPALLVLMA